MNEWEEGRKKEEKEGKGIGKGKKRRKKGRKKERERKGRKKKKEKGKTARFCYKITGCKSGRPHSLRFGINKERLGVEGKTPTVEAVCSGKLEKDCLSLGLKRRQWRRSKRVAVSSRCSYSCVLPICGYLSIPVPGTAMKSVLGDTAVEKLLLFLKT